MTSQQRRLTTSMSMLEVLLEESRKEIEASKRKSARKEALLAAINKTEDALSELQRLYSNVEATPAEIQRSEMSLIIMDAVASGCLSDQTSLELTADVLKRFPMLKPYVSKGLMERVGRVLPWRKSA